MTSRRNMLNQQERDRINEFAKERLQQCEVCQHDLSGYGWTVHNEIGYADAGGYPPDSEAEL